MKKSLLLVCFIIIASISTGQGISLLWRGGNSAWNIPGNWIQINTPIGQTPISRVPTELDSVRISGTLSGNSAASIFFPGSDSLTIGGGATSGSRCKSLHISNTTLYVNNDQSIYGFRLAVYTGSGGRVLIDSNSSMTRGHFFLNGGNPAIKDLEILNSQFGELFSHELWSSIFIGPGGKARLINSSIEGFYIGSAANGGELLVENCDFLTNYYILGENSVGTLMNSSIANDMNNGSLNFHIGKNSSFNSSNVSVTSFHTLDFYTSGSTLRGNVFLQQEHTTGSGGFLFKQADPSNPLPNIIDGNLTFQGGQSTLGIRGDVKISGDLINIPPEELFYPDTAHVFVNGQDIFKMGGITNFKNNVAINNCVDGMCNFKFEFFGSTNSRIRWTIGFPLDTMVINKSGCGKVTVDNSLYVAGQLRVQSGQLVLNPNEGIPYKLVSASNVVVNNGAGIFLRRNSAGVPANMAIGGTLTNHNTSSDSTCFGISNPYNGTILSYNPNVNFIPVPICVNSGTTITSNVSGTTYRWERNTGSGYTTISNNVNFSGATTQTLQLINIPATWHEDSIRCIVNGNMPSHTFVLGLVTSLPASVTITSDPIAVCQGANVTFYSHVVNGGLTPNYQWQLNGVNVGTNYPSFWSPNLSLNDQVKVIVQSSLVCALPQLSTSNILTVNTPASVPTVSIASTPTTVCAGSPVTFTAVSTNGGTAPIFSWHVNGSFAANGPSLIIPSVTNSFSVRVYMTSSLPCANPDNVFSEQMAITVGNSVSPSVSISASATIICPNASVIFNASPVNGGPQPSYQWQVNGSNAGTNSPTFTTSTLANGSVVKVIMTSSSPCANPITSTSNSITVTVNPGNVTPAVNIIASAITICNNANVIFTATPVNGGTQPAYQWQVNGINAGTNSPTFSTSTLANGSIVKVIMTSSSSCASPSSVTSNSITVTVSNQIIPSVSITASSQSICTNASVTFIAATVNGGTSPVYQWKKNGSNVGTNSAIFTTTSLINADVISVVMISNASCASNAPVTSNSITMSVSGSVTPGITIDGLLLVDQGGSTTVTSVVTNGGNNPGYQWQDSTSSHAWQNISNAVSPTLNYSPQFTGDKVRALLTSSAACASPSVAVSNELGFTVARPIASDRVTAFPNPATSFVIVDSLSLIDQWNTITVMSLGGKVYFSQNITGLNRVNIPVQGLLPGMYMLMLYRNVGYPLYKKFIKL